MRRKTKKLSIEDGFSYCWFLRTQCENNVAFVDIYGCGYYLPDYMCAKRIEYHTVICFEI